MATFKKAVKAESKLRLALAGPAGSGKTYTALTLAAYLADGERVAVLDTERGSASKYADRFEFDVLELEPPYHPDRYIAAIRDAEAAGYAVIVLDSLSHAWTGQGGLLEVHEQVVQRQTTKNTYTAWAAVTPIQNRFIDAITGARLHVIATMRAKSEYVQGQNAQGKAEIRKVGTAPIQRDGMEFEFDIMGELDQDNTLVVSKSRCPELAGAIIAKPGKPMAETLKTWLMGERIEEQPTGKPAAGAPIPIQDAQKKRSWGGLQARAVSAGICQTVDEWAAFVKRVCGSDFNPKASTNLDYDSVERAVADKEAENRDLANLPAMAVRP